MAADLGNMETLQDSAAALFKRGCKIDANANNVYERVIFINNAGSLGPLVSVGMSNSGKILQTLSDSMNFNVISSCYLTSELMSIYKTSRLSAVNLTIVNVSSLAALQPFESWSLYCSGKAAREMFHKVLAVENEKDACVSVLNYAPGPLDTEMSREIRESPTLGQDSKDYFQSLKDDNKLVRVEDSAAKLVKLVLMNKFVSGSHIDYFDHIEGIDDFPTGGDSITTGNPATDTNKNNSACCSVTTADVVKEGCSSCGCSAECGPLCRCAAAGVSRSKDMNMSGGGSVSAVNTAEGCSGCGCSAKCGPLCRCAAAGVSKSKDMNMSGGGSGSVSAVNTAEGCSSCGCSAECGPLCRCAVMA